MGVNYYNSERYADPTAYKAMKALGRDEKGRKERVPAGNKPHTRVWRQKDDTERLRGLLREFGKCDYPDSGQGLASQYEDTTETAKVQDGDRDQGRVRDVLPVGVVLKHDTAGRGTAADEVEGGNKEC